jgi:DNA-directed RNA polymerase specialized sigma24 family protein
MVTVRLVVAGDPEGLRRLLQDHGAIVRARLEREFDTLDGSEIDEAMGAMAVKVWNAGQRFDANKGTLRAWCAVIARRCALRLLDMRKRDPAKAEPDLDLYELPRPPVEPPSAEQVRLLADLRLSIAELPGLQRAVAQADLEAGGLAPASLLARQLKTTPNSIYVSRLRARKALRLAMARRGHDLADPPGAGGPLPPILHEPTRERP